MMEQVDIRDLKSRAGNCVWVRIPLAAGIIGRRLSHVVYKKADMVELVDTQDLGSCAFNRVSSSLTIGIVSS